MTLDEYADFTDTVAFYGGGFIYPALGLAGEAGETVDQIKKTIRDDGGVPTPERRTKIFLEMGDTLFYLARLAKELGIPFSEIAKMNIDKLTDRKLNGYKWGA